MAHELVLDLEHVWTFESIVKHYAYSCKCVVKKLHSWFLINRVKSFPTFFTPSHCLFLFATQHQKSASCTVFQCSFQIIQCRSQLNLQWFSCEQMGHPKGTPFPPVEILSRVKKSIQILRQFCGGFNKNSLVQVFLGMARLVALKSAPPPTEVATLLLITTVGGNPVISTSW